MTAIEFQSNNSGELKRFFETPVGKEFLGLLHGLRPQVSESFASESSMIRAYAKIEGYEICLRNMVGLTMPPKITEQPVANYGVPNPKTEKE